MKFDIFCWKYLYKIKGKSSIILCPFQPKQFYFSRACRNRPSNTGFKVKKGRFRLDIRKKFFKTNFVKWWNMSPRDVVDSQSDWMGFWATWSNWRWNYSFQGAWTRWTLQVPSSPNHLMIQWWFNIYYMWSLVHFECACLVLLLSHWMRMKSMHEESGLIFWIFFFCSQWVFFFLQH